MNLTRRKILKLFTLAPVALSIPLPTTEKVLFPPGHIVYDTSKNIYCSQELLDDMRAWGVDEIDRETRELYMRGDIKRVFSVSLIHD